MPLAIGLIATGGVWPLTRVAGYTLAAGVVMLWGEGSHALRRIRSEGVRRAITPPDDPEG